MSDTARPLPHRSSVSSTTSQPRAQPPKLTPQQIVDRITSPGAILFQGSSIQPPVRQRVQDRFPSQDMETRRQHNSFQQLEKVDCPSTGLT